MNRGSSNVPLVIAINVPTDLQEEVLAQKQVGRGRGVELKIFIDCTGYDSIGCGWVTRPVSVCLPVPLLWLVCLVASFCAHVLAGSEIFFYAAPSVRNSASCKVSYQTRSCLAHPL